VQLSAANSVNLKTVQSSQTNNFGAGDADNHVLSSQTSDVGTTITAGNKLQISVGQDVNAKASTLAAKTDVSIEATNNVVLEAGQTVSSYDRAVKTSSSGFLSSSSTSTHTQASTATAQVNTINGQNVSVQAGNNLVSIGPRYFSPADFWSYEASQRFTLEASTEGVIRNLRLLDEFLGYPIKPLFVPTQP
jgi:filamentous hemagglutinin